ncbi:MAG: helix-turn-helix transcriptional regulator [Bacilli bacterium]|nr:helix-turn-helix transcriptional regulator [Bacilli bacterium]
MIDITRLAEIREDNDISQEKMSAILGVKRSTYSLWELGINIIPFNYLYNFAKHFNLSIDYVLGLTNDRIPIDYPPFDLKRIGNNLKEMRIQRGLSQASLGSSLQITQACIVRYEKGLICISTSNIYKYSKFFNVSINKIIK